MEKISRKEAEKRVNEILTRGVGEFIDPNSTFQKKLIAKATGQHSGDIIVKLGADPTRPDIHLGHAVILRKLRQMQDIGCKVIFIIGDYTSMVGDPTGKSKTRPELEQSAIEENMKTYVEQVRKILRTEPEYFSWIRNSDWFTAITDLNLPEDYKVGIDIVPQGKTEKINVSFPPNSFVGKAIVFEETRMQKRIGVSKTAVITLRSLLWGLKHITLAQLIERDMFQERIKAGESLFMHEMLYPVLQGIDSDVLAQIFNSCDVEVGGTDQMFNMLIGRKIMEINNKEPQAVLSFKLLVGLDGKEKMSKSLDNYIGITDKPEDMFGKTMSIPDSAIASYYELCTFTPNEEIEEIRKKLTGGNINPRDLKLDLAQQIVEIYHGQTVAKTTRENFIATFQNKTLPTDIRELKVKKGIPLVDILIEAELVSSKTDFRRLVDEGAIRIDGERKISDPKMVVSDTITLKVGKHRFIKIIVE